MRVLSRFILPPAHSAGMLAGRARAALARGLSRLPRPLLEYSAALLGVAITTVVIAAILSVTPPVNLSLLYLIVVLWLAATFGRWPAVAAAVLAFLAYDFFFVPPLHGPTVDDPAEWISLSALLATALVLGQLTSAVRARADDAARSERRAATLYALSQLIASTPDLDGLLAALVGRVLAVFSSSGLTVCGLILPDAAGNPVPRAQAPAHETLAAPLNLSTPEELAQARWTLEHGKSVGGLIAPPEHPGDERLYYFIPLASGRRVVGVLGVAGTHTLQRLVEALPTRTGVAPALATRPERDPQASLLAAFCEQIALALDRAVLQQQAIHAEALREGDRLKDVFLGSITHDLRTPLASITSATGSLLDPNAQLSDADRRALLTSIDVSAARLNRLVGNLLDLSRLEAGVAAPERDWYLIGDVIATVLDRLELAGELGERPIHLDEPADLPLVPMDHAQIEQVLTNLLENAVKYSPPSSPIHITARVDPTLSELEVIIRDEGIGIPPGELSAIFEKFYRIRNVELPWLSARPPSGTGLGLAISAAIVEAHGGRIWAESRPGAGTAIHFILPIPRDTPAGALPELGPAPAEAQPQRTGV
jgi:two-component system, OmpR family, sensor histidine kinase KdpD